MFLKKLSTFLLDITEVIVFSIAIFLLVYLLLLQPHKIKGFSMEPNFSNGEYLLTEKVSYRFKNPKRGDVVVFKAPNSENEEFIKRIIGLPGEKVSIKQGKVYINGRQLKESYLPKETITLGMSFLKENEEKNIPEGYFFVLGDNRNHSSDSRVWGLINKKAITGRAWIVYWPPQKIRIVKDVNY